MTDRAPPEDAGRYRARHLLLIPGLLSLARVPLAVLFPFLVLPAERPLSAFVALLAAGCTDVLDGWFARRLGQVTATGVALDGITDKIFWLTVALSLLAAGLLTPLAILLLTTREIGEAALALWLIVKAPERGERAQRPGPNLAGKGATVLQFAAVSAALFRAPYVEWLVGATALSGAAAVFAYARRIPGSAGGETRSVLTNSQEVKSAPANVDPSPPQHVREQSDSART